MYTSPSLFVLDSFLIMSKGETTGILSEDPLDYCILAAGAAVAWVYAIVTIFVTFRRKRGVYFWSILVSSWRLSIQALGFILKFLVGTNWRLNIHRVTTGWIAMVTGQAVALYSGLHLVVWNRRTLSYVLCLIFFNVIAPHVPTVIFTSAATHPAPMPASMEAKKI